MIIMNNLKYDLLKASFNLRQCVISDYNYKQLNFSPKKINAKCSTLETKTRLYSIHVHSTAERDKLESQLNISRWRSTLIQIDASANGRDLAVEYGHAAQQWRRADISERN